MLAAPVEAVGETFEDKRNPDGHAVSEATSFARKHSQVFRRLGIDLIRVSEDGSAVVHMKPEVVDQLSARANTLDELGAREQSRWATIDHFDLIPDEFRIDREWLRGIASQEGH